MDIDLLNIFDVDDKKFLDKWINMEYDMGDSIISEWGYDEWGNCIINRVDVKYLIFKYE